MAIEVKATYEAVVAAAEALEKEGVTPSVRNITKHIGGGSPNVISAHKRRWITERPRIEARRAIAIDQSISDSIAAALQKAADEASAAAIAERDEANDEKDLIVQRGLELELQVDQLTQQVAELTQKGQHDAGVIETLKDEAATAHTDAANEVERVRAETTAAIGEARAEAAKERARADQLVAELATANVRLEALRGVEEKLERVIAELHAEHDQRLVAEGKANTIPGLKDEIAELHASLKTLGDKLDAERAKADQIRSDAAIALAQAREQSAGDLNALRAQLEQRIDAERKLAADAERAAAAADRTGAAEKARADALAAHVAELRAQLEAAKSKPSEEAKS